MEAQFALKLSPIEKLHGRLFLTSDILLTPAWITYYHFRSGEKGPEKLWCQNSPRARSRKSWIIDFPRRSSFVKDLEGRIPLWPITTYMEEPLPGATEQWNCTLCMCQKLNHFLLTLHKHMQKIVNRRIQICINKKQKVSEVFACIILR